MRATREKSGIYVSDENYTHMTETLETQKAELEDLTGRIESLRKEMADLQELFDDTSSTLTTTQAQLEETAQDLAETSRHLAATEAELQTTALERDQTVFISEQQAATEDELRTQAQALVTVAETTTEHVEGLHAKIGRKAAVEAHNLTAGQSLQGKVAVQVTASKQGLSAYSQQQQAAMAATVTKLQGFTDQVASTMASMAQTVG